jgi:hypothetical protein
MNMLHKVRIALAVTLMALATLSVVDSASAVIYKYKTFFSDFSDDVGP